LRRSQKKSTTDYPQQYGCDSALKLDIGIVKLFSLRILYEMEVYTMNTYDFETVIRRHGVGSGKWNEMSSFPEVPKDVIPFSVADMEFTTMPEVKEGLKEFIDTHVLGYANPTSEYKAAVQNWMQRHHDWTIQPDWILDAPGVINAFFTAVKAFSAPGEGVLLMTPVYYPMYMAIERNGRKQVSSPLINEGGRYRIDFEDFEAKAKASDTKLLLLCSPHNPSGRVWTKEELTRIGRICMDNNVLVCSDEIHNDLIMPGFRHTVFASLSDEFAQHSIVCTAPSKTFILAGLQTSNIIIPNPDLRKRFLTEVLKSEGNPKCNILGLEACRLAYTHGDAWLKQLLAIINKNRQIIVDFFEREFPAVQVTPLEGTYLLWIDFRPLGIDAHELARILREEAFLFFDDGFIFGDEGSGFERWNLACPTSYITAALERLKSTLNNHI